MQPNHHMPTDALLCPISDAGERHAPGWRRWAKATGQEEPAQPIGASTELRKISRGELGTKLASFSLVLRTQHALFAGSGKPFERAIACSSTSAAAASPTLAVSAVKSVAPHLQRWPTCCRGLDGVGRSARSLSSSQAAACLAAPLGFSLGPRMSRAEMAAAVAVQNSGAIEQQNNGSRWGARWREGWQGRCRRHCLLPAASRHPSPPACSPRHSPALPFDPMQQQQQQQQQQRGT